jgi:site-specific recombinase XerD
MANLTYKQQSDNKYIKQLRELEKKLPAFCVQFFTGIDLTTAPRTQVAYATDLKTFFEYIKLNYAEYADKDIHDYPLKLLTDLKAQDFEQFVQYVKLYSDEEGRDVVNHERGIKRKLSAIRCMYNYFHKNRLISENPVLQVNMPKLHDKAIIRFEPEETADFLDQVENGDMLTKKQQQFHEKLGTRDLAIFTLLLGTGIRVSECVGLDLQDVDIKNSRIKVTRKGGYEAFVYFGDEVLSALIPYLEERKGIIPESGHENALFLSSRKRRICVRNIEYMVKKYALPVTPGKKITPHKLRSTYGTTLYQETGDIYLVADVLGHKDVNTTKKHYAAIEDDRRRQARNIVKLREKKD